MRSLQPQGCSWRLAGRTMAIVLGPLLWLMHAGVGAQSISPVMPAGSAAGSSSGAALAAVTPVAAVPVAAAVAVPDYHPSMGDLMTMAVQPRHIKLGLAGAQRNWAYATYELSELRNAFNRIGRTIPKYNGADTPAVLDAMTHAPLDSLEQAIRAGSAAQFKQAYAVLTATCNACHISQNHAPVVIKVPDAASYPDQDFRTPKR